MPPNLRENAVDADLGPSPDLVQQQARSPGNIDPLAVEPKLVGLTRSVGRRLSTGCLRPFPSVGLQSLGFVSPLPEHVRDLGGGLGAGRVVLLDLAAARCPVDGPRGPGPHVISGGQ